MSRERDERKDEKELPGEPGGLPGSADERPEGGPEPEQPEAEAESGGVNPDPRKPNP